MGGSTVRERFTWKPFDAADRSEGGRSRVSGLGLD